MIGGDVGSLKLGPFPADNRAMTTLKIATIGFILANAGVAVLASDALAGARWGG